MTTAMDIETSILEIIASEYQVDVANIDRKQQIDFNMSDIVFFLFELEEKLDIEIRDDEFIKGKNIDDIIDFVKKRLPDN